MKQTVVIIVTYVASSTPFIFAQLWVAWGSPGEAVSKFIIHIILTLICLKIGLFLSDFEKVKILGDFFGYLEKHPF